MKKLIIATILLPLVFACGTTPINQPSTATTQTLETATSTAPATSPSTSTTVADDSLISSKWVSPLCDERALHTKRPTYLPETRPENPWGALIHPAPEGDDFWIPPNPIPGKPGDIIWARYEGDLDPDRSRLDDAPDPTSLRARCGLDAGV